MKRINKSALMLALSLILVLSIVLAGCSNSKSSSGQTAVSSSAPTPTSSAIGQNSTNSSATPSPSASSSKGNQPAGKWQIDEWSGKTEDLSFYTGDVSPFKSPVPISVGWTALPAGVTGLPSGETQDNNKYISYVEKTLNVKFNWSFRVPADQYNTKVNLAITNGQMPDVMNVNRQEFSQLAQGGKLEDMTSAFNKYASPYLKEMASKESLSEATVNGKLLAIPSSKPGLQDNLLWIRKDWLDQLHLEVPQTVEQLDNAIHQFVSNHLGGQDTVGLISPGNKTAFTGLSNFSNVFGWGTMFSAYGAYPAQWINVNGKAKYGSVQPEAKQALEELHKMYAAGDIDSQFVTASADQEQSEVVGGKAGAFFYPLSGGMLAAQSMTKDPKANWVPVLAPLGSNGKLNWPQAMPATSYIVVKKGFANPEAIVKVLNLDVTLQSHNPDTLNLYGDASTLPSWANIPLDVTVSPFDQFPSIYHQLDNAVKANSDAQLATRWAQFYPLIKKTLDAKGDWSKVDNTSLGRYLYLYVAGGLIANNLTNINQQQVLDVVVPNNMTAQWSQLQKMESQIYYQIITGEQPLSAFDDFVQQWNKLGGDQLTKYVQDNIETLK